MGKGLLDENIEIIFKININTTIVPEDMHTLHAGYIKILQYSFRKVEFLKQQIVGFIGLIV